MSYKKTIFFMFFIIILSSFALAQTQPTLFYGQILSGGNPIENIMISAEWIDDSSNTRFTKSSTLSKSQAQNMGQPYIYGFYSFTNGNIQAKPGTDIILSVEGIDGKVIMKTRPGSQPILINPIIIRQSSTQGSVLDGFKKAVGLSTETKTPGYYLNANGEEGVYKTYQKTGTKEKENDNYVRANENINENIQNKIPESSPNIQEAKTNLEALEITKVQETGEVDSKRGFNNISIFFMDFLKVIFLLLVLALIIGLLFLIYHYIIRNVAKKLSGISLDPVVNNTRRVFNIKVGDIAPQTRKISKNQEYTIALTNLVDYNTDT